MRPGKLAVPELQLQIDITPLWLKKREHSSIRTRVLATEHLREKLLQTSY